MASRYKATVVLVGGSVHTGHGDLGLNLDAHLTSLGARMLSVNDAVQKIPPHRSLCAPHVWPVRRWRVDSDH